MPQDMPPVGGYGPVQYKVRHLSSFFFSFSFSCLVCCLAGEGGEMEYGWMDVGSTRPDLTQLASSQLWLLVRFDRERPLDPTSDMRHPTHDDPVCQTPGMFHGDELTKGRRDPVITKAGARGDRWRFDYRIQNKLKMREWAREE